MKKIIIPISGDGNLPPLLVKGPIEASTGVDRSPSQPLVLKPVSPATSPSKSSTVQLNTLTASTPTNVSNMRLVRTADGKKLLLTSIVSSSNPSVSKQVILMPRSEINIASPTATTAILSTMAGQLLVNPVMSSNAPRTVILNPSKPVSPSGSAAPPPNQPIVLQIPGLNQPIVVKQCSSESPASSNGESHSPVPQMITASSSPSSSTTVINSTSTTTATNPIMYLKSGSATYKVVGKPVPVKLFPKLPKLAPKIMVNPGAIQKIPLPPLKKADSVHTVELTSPVKSTPSAGPPAYLNICIKEEPKEGDVDEGDLRIKEEEEDTMEEPEEPAEPSQEIEAMLDVRIKEEPKDDQTGELLARDEQLRQVLGVTSNLPTSRRSRFFIRTSEGKLVTISPEEAQALGLDHQDKVENNQKKLMNALNQYNGFKVSSLHMAIGQDSVMGMKQDSNILIPNNVNVKDYVSCHVSPAAEKTASIMKTLGNKRLETNMKGILAFKSSTTILGEFTEADRRFLRIEVETESHGKDVCDVIITPLNTYQCPFCIREFKTKDHVITHLRIHTGERPYPCEVCGKRYRQRIDIIRHMRIHTGEKPFTCGLCNASFNQKSNLRSHMRIHTGERPVQCNVCGKGFSRNTHLKQHMKLHTGEKPFQCKVCYRPFRFKSGLQAHERIHTGLKPYACSLCGRTFTQIVGLLRHERTHVGEKPFRCQSCGKSFNSRENLKAHVLKHTSVRPYECDLCDKSFTDRSSLRCHRKKYHCNNLMCVICLREDFKDRIDLREHLRAHERENWEETPEGDLVPLVRDFDSEHFISVDDTLENLNPSDEDELMSEENQGTEQIQVEVDLGADDPMENDNAQEDDDNDDSEYEEHELNIESCDPLA